MYDYECKKCGKVSERDFRIGEAPKEVRCSSCKSASRRFYGTMSFILKGGGWPGKKSTFNKEMTERNATASRRMRKEHGDGPMKMVAHDYGDGDVREVE